MEAIVTSKNRCPQCGGRKWRCYYLSDGVAIPPRVFVPYVDMNEGTAWLVQVIHEDEPAIDECLRCHAIVFA